MAGRIFGTRAAREAAAANTGEPEVPAYPDLPNKLNKLIFETPLLVNRRHDTYAVILDGCMMQAEEMAISSWLIRTWGDHLTNEQFAIAQDLLIFKAKAAIEENERALKHQQEFTQENYLQGHI